MTLGPLWKRNAGREDEPRSLAVFLRWAVLLWVDYSSRIFLLHERPLLTTERCSYFANKGVPMSLNSLSSLLANMCVRDVFPLQEEEELVVLWTR